MRRTTALGFNNFFEAWCRIVIFCIERASEHRTTVFQGTLEKIPAGKKSENLCNG